jgi:hypothetical protein
VIIISLSQELVDKENELHMVKMQIEALRQRELELVNGIMAIEDDLGIRNYEYKRNRV